MPLPLNLLTSAAGSVAKGGLSSLGGEAAKSLVQGNDYANFQAGALANMVKDMNSAGLTGMIGPFGGGVGPMVPSQQGGIGGELQKLEQEVQELEKDIQQMMGGAQTPSPMDQIQDGAQQMQQGRGEKAEGRADVQSAMKDFGNGDFTKAADEFSKGMGLEKSGRDDMRAGRQEAEEGYQAETGGQVSQQSPLGGLTSGAPAMMSPGFLPLMNREESTADA